MSLCLVLKFARPLIPIFLQIWSAVLILCIHYKSSQFEGGVVDFCALTSRDLRRADAFSMCSAFCWLGWSAHFQASLADEQGAAYRKET